MTEFSLLLASPWLCLVLAAQPAICEQRSYITAVTVEPSSLKTGESATLQVEIGALKSAQASIEIRLDKCLSLPEKSGEFLTDRDEFEVAAVENKMKNLAIVRINLDAKKFGPLEDGILSLRLIADARNEHCRVEARIIDHVLETKAETREVSVGG